jgi:hypothetical protein
MNAVARPWIGLCFKLMAVLAFIFAFIFFMRMQEDQSRVDNYRNAGTVSRAVVTEKKKDTITTQTSGLRRRSSGSTTTSDIWVLSVRFAPKSTVKYADYPSKVKEADLPTAPDLTGDTMKDSEASEIMWVSQDLYDKTKVGDMLTVVDAPFSGFGPELISDVRDFDPSEAYPKIAIALVLMLLFWFIGRRISKASMLRGIAAVSTVPGTNP